MASSAVIAAVKSRAASYWSVTDPDTGAAVPIYELNSVAQVPPEGGAYLAIEYPIANAEQISVGAPGAQLYREEGGIRFVLAIPLGSKVTWWLQQLEALLANFRSVSFSGVRTYAPTSPVFDENADRAGYWRLTAAVPYYRDTLG